MGTRERPTRVRYLVVAAACSLAVVAYVHRVGFALALPALGLGKREGAYLGAAFLFGYGLFEIPFGVLCDRLGGRHLLAVLVLAWSALTAAVALAGLLPVLWVLPFLVAVRFAFGILQAGAFPSVSRILTDWVTRRERASAQGFIWMASRAGGVIAGPVLYLAAQPSGSWQQALILLSFLGLAWSAAFWPWFRDRPEQMPAVNAAEARLIADGRAPAAGHGNIPWGRLLRSPSVWGLCLMYGFVGFASNFLVTLLPDYLQKEVGLTGDTTKVLNSVMFGCGMVACVSGGVLSDTILRRTGSRKWARRFNGMVFLTLGSLGWLALGSASGLWGVGIALCAVYFCNDLNMGPAWAACGDVGERYAGTVGGAMNMIGNFMGALGGLTAGELFEHGKAGTMFALFATSWCLAGLCWLLVDVTRPLPQGDES